MSYDESKPWALHAVIIKKSVPKDEALQHAENIIKKKEFKARETKLTWRFRALPKTKFKKEKFRSKKVNKDITLVFGELLPEHAKLSGRGFFDFFKKGYESVKEKVGQLADTATDYFKPRLDGYDNKTTSMLKQIGDLPITRLQIYKAPLREMFDKALNLISLGAWSKAKKKYGFDTFFHLGLLATLDNGQTYIVEKLDRPSVSQDFNLNEQGLELLDVPLTGLGAKRLTINGLLEDARKAVGDQKFFEYDSFRNNCQFFVRMLLDNQGLYTEREKNFFFQDISQLVNELPEYVQSFQRLATDTTATIGKLRGEGTPHINDKGQLVDKDGKIVEVKFAETDEQKMGYAERLANEAKKIGKFYGFGKMRGKGVEDFVVDKVKEKAEGFAKSLGGENLFTKLGEDLGDMFSGERYGYTREKRVQEREDQAKAQEQAQTEEYNERRKANPQQAETDDWTNERQTNLTQELYEPWRAKFGQSITGYSADFYPPDASGFDRLVRRKGLKSKAEVEKLYVKVRKDALQTLKKGDREEAERKYNQQYVKQEGSGKCMACMRNPSVEEQEEEAKRYYDEQLQSMNEASRLPKDLNALIASYVPDADDTLLEEIISEMTPQERERMSVLAPLALKRYKKDLVRVRKESRNLTGQPIYSNFKEKKDGSLQGDGRVKKGEPTKEDLIKILKERGVKGYSKMTRGQLLEAVETKGRDEAYWNKQIKEKTKRAKEKIAEESNPDIFTEDHYAIEAQWRVFTPITGYKYDKKKDDLEEIRDKKYIAFLIRRPLTATSVARFYVPYDGKEKKIYKDDVLKALKKFAPKFNFEMADVYQTRIIKMERKGKKLDNKFYEQIAREHTYDDKYIIVDDRNLEGDGMSGGKPSRGYYFIKALNASKAPKNSQKASIVDWRKQNAENAERINESKFRKFDYSKLPKGSENNARRTKNPNPVGLHPVYEPTETDLNTGRNYGGLYALKKEKKEEQEEKLLTLEDLDEDDYVLYSDVGDGKFAVVGIENGDEENWDEKGYIMLRRPKKGWDSVKKLGNFTVNYFSDDDINHLYLTRIKKEKKPKKAPQQNPEEKEEADFKEERPAPPEPDAEELARGHYEADTEQLRKAIKKRGDERFGKAEFNKVLVRVRKRMQRERDKAQGIERKYK